MSGCTTVTPIDTGGTDPVAGWNAETRHLAERSWLYAQLAINVYTDRESFILPGDLVQRVVTGNDDSGYAYAIYDRFEGDELVETIIVYRGTDANLKDGPVDILHGAIGVQHGRGLDTARAAYAQLQRAGLNDAELSVTGHSLGGAIAHHVVEHALDESGGFVTRSAVFNNAPRLAGLRQQQPERIALVERGDWAGILRAFGNAPADLHRSIDCKPGFAPFRDHSMRQLAECLTWIAAIEDPAARLSLVANPVVKRPGRQSDDRTPPTADQANGAGVPINPYVDDAALARFVDAELRAIAGLSPLYSARSGYRVEIAYDRTLQTAHVAWLRNGVTLPDLNAAISCQESALDDCAGRILAPGARYIAAQLRLRTH